MKILIDNYRKQTTYQVTNNYSDVVFISQVNGSSYKYDMTRNVIDDERMYCKPPQRIVDVKFMISNCYLKLTSIDMGKRRSQCYSYTYFPNLPGILIRTRK